MTIGYFSARVAALPRDDCRIVVWLDHDGAPAQLAALDEISGSSDEVCRIDPATQRHEVEQ